MIRIKFPVFKLRTYKRCKAHSFIEFKKSANKLFKYEREKYKHTFLWKFRWIIAFAIWIFFKIIGVWEEEY
jgi:hypothetical protein